jgi:hypothetical protein
LLQLTVSEKGGGRLVGIIFILLEFAFVGLGIVVAERAGWPVPDVDHGGIWGVAGFGGDCLKD